MLRTRLGMTITIVLMLGVTWGFLGGVFSVANALLFRPFPVADPDTWVYLWEYSSETPLMFVSYANYLDWRTQNHVFDDMAVFRRAGFNLALKGQTPARVAGAFASSNAFNVMKFAPIL